MRQCTNYPEIPDNSKRRRGARTDQLGDQVILVIQPVSETYMLTGNK